MAVRQLKDGRWICYYRVKGPDGRNIQKSEYFGRGPGGHVKARARNSELDLKPRRPAKIDIGPLFGELVKAYVMSKVFNCATGEVLRYRLQAGYDRQIDLLFDK